jgi:mRNA interferase MazF
VCSFRQPVGPHPAVVLIVNRVAQPLASVTVAVITGTEGPTETHVPVSGESGLKKYDESFVDCTDLHTVSKPQLRRRLGLLAQGELRAVEENVRAILGLN